jgi:periplasmic divalent cation tolerance protein
MNIILVYITNPNLPTAKKIAQHLLNKKLIACANFFPIGSLYCWQGKVNDSSEVVAILKTKEENWDKIKAEVKKIHPYEMPCIIKIKAESNKEYGKWIEASLK